MGWFDKKKIPQHPPTAPQPPLRPAAPPGPPPTFPPPGPPSHGERALRLEERRVEALESIAVSLGILMEQFAKEPRKT